MSGHVSRRRAPTNVTASTRTTTSIALTWAPATDNVGVAGYGIYNAAELVNTTAGTTGIVSGLTCGTNYTLAVDAFDATGNSSPKTAMMVSTLPCTDPLSQPGTTITGAQFEQRCNVAGSSLDNVTVNASGTLSCGAANVTVQNSKLSGFRARHRLGRRRLPAPQHGHRERRLQHLGRRQRDDRGRRVRRRRPGQLQPDVDAPAANGPVGFVIRNNSFSNYRGGDCSVHGEALFVGGYSRDGLIEGNTFSNDGCTSHIFFSYFGNAGVSGFNSAQLPHNICVRGNTFGPRFLNTYVDVNFRQEIANAGPATTQIKVQPGAGTTNPEFNAVC